MSQVKTYNAKQVTISFGTHAVTGLADDSFVTIEPLGDGISAKAGCDGEIARSIDPNGMYSVKIVLLQTSKTNQYLQTQYNNDRASGNGTFPILVKDLRGNFKFSAEAAWVTKPASRGFGKEAANREWDLNTGEATVEDGTY